MIPTHRAPTHPGDLARRIPEAEGLTQTAAAEKMGISNSRVNELIRGKRDATADTALRLASC